MDTAILENECPARRERIDRHVEAVDRRGEVRGLRDVPVRMLRTRCGSHASPAGIPPPCNWCCTGRRIFIHVLQCGALTFRWHNSLEPCSEVRSVLVITGLLGVVLLLVELLDLLRVIDDLGIERRLLRLLVRDLTEEQSNLLMRCRYAAN